MALIEMNAHRRDRYPFAETLKTWVKKFRIYVAPAPPIPRDISDHLARDIGLSSADLERLRFELPSQSAGSPPL